MKTAFEVEQMKIKIEQKIQDVQQQIFNVCECQYSVPSLEQLTDKKRQLMAQYNILLEVLS